jgi:hypothetical protein
MLTNFLLKPLNSNRHTSIRFPSEVVGSPCRWCTICTTFGQKRSWQSDHTTSCPSEFPRRTCINFTAGPCMLVDNAPRRLRDATSAGSAPDVSRWRSTSSTSLGEGYLGPDQIITCTDAGVIVEKTRISMLVAWCIWAVRKPRVLCINVGLARAPMTRTRT